MIKQIIINNIPYNRRLFNKTIYFGSDFIEHKIKPDKSYYTFNISEQKEEIINGVKHLKIVSSKNDIIYTVNGEIHREGDLPAIIYYGVGSFWFKNNQPHRDNDLPACEFINETKEWHYLGKIHRDGKPAIIFKNPLDSEWFLNGVYHRENDLPAKIYHFSGGVLQKWYILGEKRRLSHNPCLIVSNNDSGDYDYFEWYLHNQPCSKEDFDQYWLSNNIKFFK